MDQTLATILRKNAKNVLLVANKSEGSAGDTGTIEAWGLGLGEPISISAEHGEGMGDLLHALMPFADRFECEMVAGMETGGRSSSELVAFLRHLAKFKAESAPPILRKASAMVLERRWKGFLAVACQRVYAQSLLQDVMGAGQCDGGVLPDWGDLL